ncbi:MAG: YvcK family protein [Acidobacteria bacterium]|nr:YvcK family protein [Acidobacteriota bacterium]
MANNHPSDKTYTVSVIGGGTGSFSVLSGLGPYENLQINSIVTMMDSGGDSGRLRDEFGMLPPGDVRRCLVALSEESKLLRDLFSFRFVNAPLENRSFGNLFLLALTKMLGSEKEAVEAISRILKIRGRVIPVTWNHSHLYAELADGKIVAGEANISVPEHDARIPIERVYLDPQADANPEAVEAILESDFVVFAPGDLFTSTIPNLLVKGIPEAIRQTRAPVIYVLNLMTKHGETDDYSASQHVAQIIRYAGRSPDAVLVHQGTVPAEMALKYEEEKARQVRVDVADLHRLGVKLVKAGDVMSATSLVRHDSARTAKALIDVFDELNPMNH